MADTKTLDAGLIVIAVIILSSFLSCSSNARDEYIPNPGYRQATPAPAPAPQAAPAPAPTESAQ